MDELIESIFPSSKVIVNLIDAYLLDVVNQSMMLNLFITNNNLSGLQNLVCYQNPEFDFLILHCATFNLHQKNVLEFLIGKKKTQFLSFMHHGCFPNESFWDCMYSKMSAVQAISFVEDIFQHSLTYEFIKAATHLFLFFKNHCHYANEHGFFFLDKLMVGYGLICRFLPFLHKEKVIAFLKQDRLLIKEITFEINLLKLYFEL